MRNNITVKVNLNNIVKMHFIKIREIDNRDVTKDVKLNELRHIQYFLDGTIAVIEHTGSYIEEMSLLLSLRRETYAIIQKYVPE